MKAMLNMDSIENYIREHKDEFDVYRPPESHLDRFLFKINYRIRYMISIVPHLIRVAIATIIIFAASIIVWNNYIRRDRAEITLKNKVTLVINRISKILK